MLRRTLKCLALVLFTLIGAALFAQTSHAAATYDFGGIYSNNSSCPGGYSAAQFEAGNSLMPNLYFCYRTASTATGIDFGGMYVTDSSNSLSVNNPETGVQSCPSGYSTSSGLSGSRFTVYYCYKNVSSPSNTGDFGGAFGQYCTESISSASCDNTAVSYNNPYPASVQCPSNYAVRILKIDVIGASPYMKEWRFAYCTNYGGSSYKNIGLRANQGTQVSPSIVSLAAIGAGNPVEIFCSAEKLGDQSHTESANCTSQQGVSHTEDVTGSGSTFSNPPISIRHTIQDYCTDTGSNYQSFSTFADQRWFYRCSGSGSSESSPLHIAVNNIIYQMALVAVGDGNASKLRIRLSDGTTKAIRLCTVANSCQ